MDKNILLRRVVDGKKMTWNGVKTYTKNTTYIVL